MRRNHGYLGAALLFLVVALPVPAEDSDTPLASLPYTPGLDPASMDRAADPCVDFYQFSCGGWLRNHPVPGDQARWSVYGKLAFDNQRYLWGILQELAARTSGRDAIQRRIGDHFAACMDEAAVEARGVAPLEPDLKAIDRLQSKRGLADLVARLQLATGSSRFFFGFGANQDFADSTQVIAFAAAGGLGLPDRDYYLKDDARSKEILAKYEAHVARMFEMLGEATATAAASARTVMAIETALARASLSRVDRRDPYKLFHKVDFAGLRKLAPAFDWDAYLRRLGLPRQRTFNVTEPAFFRALDAEITARSLPELRTYLRWQAVRTAAPFLPKAFVEENFGFFSRTLRGVPQLQPRWKRCVTLVDAQLGEDLGQEFVRRTFSAELKAKVLRMTRQVEDAMRRDIEELPWMGPQTKKRALEKLHSVVNKIGYPDKWRDYSRYEVRRNDFYGNVQRGNLFEARRDLAKIGKPVDRGEWFMTPPTVNAYYNPQLNDINFAAGVLQPPLYDPKMDDAPNYGNTGGTIGHELTHGFDDEGRQYDARGNLKDWWTKEDGAAFTERAQCIADQYAQYTIVDDIRINSKLTLGEDVADVGGVILAWMAWKAETAGKALVSRDGLTPEQRFFVGFAQWACENDRPENQRVNALTDPHSPGKYRVNGVVVNMPEFARAFSCKPGAPMAPEKRCRVW
jgi:putative endopeptidase